MVTETTYPSKCQSAFFAYVRHNATLPSVRSELRFPLILLLCHPDDGGSNESSKEIWNVPLETHAFCVYCLEHWKGSYSFWNVLNMLYHIAFFFSTAYKNLPHSALTFCFNKGSLFCSLVCLKLSAPTLCPSNCCNSRYISPHLTSELLYIIVTTLWDRGPAGYLTICKPVGCFIFSAL